jgi:hypothetical protein
MTEGIRFGLKEGRYLSQGRHGTSVDFQAACVSRLLLFCIAGLVSVGIAISASAQLVSTNVDAAVSYMVSSRGTMSVLATKNPENDQFSRETQTLENKIDGEPMPNLSIGVEIVGGLALFLWIQRFRNYSV